MIERKLLALEIASSKLSLERGLGLSLVLDNGLGCVCYSIWCGSLDLYLVVIVV